MSVRDDTGIAHEGINDDVSACRRRWYIRTYKNMESSSRVLHTLGLLLL